MAKTTLAVRPRVVNGTLGRHLAEIAIVGVTVNRAGVVRARQVVVREATAGVLVVLVVLVGVLVVLVLVLVGVYAGTSASSRAASDGTGGGHGVNSGDGSTSNWGWNSGTSSGIGIGDAAGGRIVGATGVDVIVSAGGESRNGSSEESKESERSLGRHVDDDLN